jgi:anti-sigma regulatory factor (Ser/Thr protein kinase)
MALLDVRLPALPEAVPAARRALAEALDGQPDELVERAKIVLSELVTNGIRHGADPQVGWVRMVVSERAGRLRIEVTDSGESPGAPRVRTARRDETGGWGLYLVANLTTSWGFSLDGDRTVWCELEHPG